MSTNLEKIFSLQIPNQEVVLSSFFFYLMFASSDLFKLDNQKMDVILKHCITFLLQSDSENVVNLSIIFCLNEIITEDRVKNYFCVHFQDYAFNLVQKLFVFEFEEFHKLMIQILNRDLFLHASEFLFLVFKEILEKSL